jgi:tRNA-modifying protein YgfZ
MTGYEAVKKTTGVADRSGEARFRVTGPDRVTWLQGLLTNDIAALQPGTGCYAAYLTPQGRMLADVRVLHLGDQLLLDVPAVARETVFERLNTFIIMEDVTLEDVTDTLARLAIFGPKAFDTLSAVLAAGDEVQSLAEHASVQVQARFQEQEQTVIVAGSRDFGAATPGFDLYCPAAAKPALLAALHAAAPGVEDVDGEAWNTLRIEAGRPLFGVDMSTDTIPLEAGIEDRAISFTKGCYVGQEIIIRVMHRGHGRVAKKLVGLQASAPVEIPRDAPIYAGEKEIGRVTSAAYSPTLERWLAMGYVHRDYIEPNTGVSIGANEPRVTAKVVELPFIK